MATMPDWFIWTNSTELGQAVLVAREAANWTQSMLAKRAGVTRKFVYELERGKGTLRVDKVMQVLGALGLMPVIVPAEVMRLLR